MKKTIIYHDKHQVWNYPDADGVVRHHVYPITEDSTKERELEADSEDSLFERFYKMNNTLRYCNGMYYEFKNPEDTKSYQEWVNNLSHSRSFDLYYGGGIVD